MPAVVPSLPSHLCFYLLPVCTFLHVSSHSLCSLFYPVPQSIEALSHLLILYNSFVLSSKLPRDNFSCYNINKLYVLYQSVLWDFNSICIINSSYDHGSQLALHHVINAQCCPPDWLTVPCWTVICLHNLDFLAVDLHQSLPEVHPNRGLGFLGEPAGAEAVGEAGLPDPGVPDHNDFEYAGPWRREGRARQGAGEFNRRPDVGHSRQAGVRLGHCLAWDEDCPRKVFTAVGQVTHALYVKRTRFVRTGVCPGTSASQ